MASRAEIEHSLADLDDGEFQQSLARIKVVGVGGGGANAVNRMIEAGVDGIEYIVANTDRQALQHSKAPTRLQLGRKLTKGLGAGADPDVGRKAALEDTELLVEQLHGADMVFVTAGLGGGTGSGAAPVIASLATELGALTVAVVTKPFGFEGKRRMSQALKSWNELAECADTVITIPNEKLLQTVPRSLPLTGAFQVADDVLRQAVQGISDLVTIPGLINLDFADVKTVMRGMGMALMAIGESDGAGRAINATLQAIKSPLLDDSTLRGAQGVLINVTGGEDLTLHEVSEASMLICEQAEKDANIIFGAVIDKAMTGRIKITVIATGFALPSNSVRKRSGAKYEVPGQQYLLPALTDFGHVDRSDADVPAYLRVQIDSEKSKS